MYSVRKLNDELYYLGASDRRLALFETAYPIPRGVSYNAYLIRDDTTVLMDTVDRSVAERFFENLEAALGDKALDFVVVSHMEPDHSATLDEVLRRYPDITVVCNTKTYVMLEQFLGKTPENVWVVSEGDTLETGRHTLTFMMAPMVHWPEVMVSFDTATGTLFSADAFGTFGALAGNLYADEVPFERDWLPDARRYYTNIVGKYGTQVTALLKKAAGLDIRMICPLHGPIWRTNIGWFIEKYQKWATYTPEDNAVLIAYASVYGGTENAANILADELAKLGVRGITMFDVSVTDLSEVVAEAFRCSHLVFASTTYNAGIFRNMETLLLDLKAHNLRKRTVALIENGSWAPTSGKLMRELIGSMRDMTILDETVSVKSAVSREDSSALRRLAAALYETMPKRTIEHEAKIEPNAMFKLSYGLFVLTARADGKDNGCIVNTVTQVTDNPKCIQLAVNKSSLTHDMVLATGVFNVSVLTTETPFKVFRHFGFQSGREVDKFADCEDIRSDNGVRYIPKYTNAYLSGRVLSTQNLGTHTVFTAEITRAVVLSNVPSATYQYYFDRIKPKPQQTEKPVRGYICKVCGWIYEGDELPADIICPVCKHGADAFEKLPE